MNIKTQSPRADSLAMIETPEIIRVKTGMKGFDKLTGGGLVPGTATLFSGERGAGKSTFLMQLANIVSSENKILYISGEESLEQLKYRADRLDAVSPDFFCSENVALEDVTALVEKLKPRFLIIDSLQMMFARSSKAVTGGPTQTKKCLNEIIKLTREKNMITIVISHVTKSGDFSGASTLQHAVDILMQMSIADDGVRVITTDKNRYGEAQLNWDIIMTQKGFQEIDNNVNIQYAAKEEIERIKEFKQQYREEEVTYQEIKRSARTGSFFANMIFDHIIEPYLLEIIFGKADKKRVRDYKLVFTLDQ